MLCPIHQKQYIYIYNIPCTCMFMYIHVVYIIQGTGKGVFIYMIFIIHVLAALILSRLANTCYWQTRSFWFPLSSLHRACVITSRHAMIFNETLNMHIFGGVTMWINRWVCFHHIQTACIYVYMRMCIDPKYGTCTINVICIYIVCVRVCTCV